MGLHTAQLHGIAVLLVIIAPVWTYPADKKSTAPDTSLARLMGEMRTKAKILETSAGMRLSFRSFTTAYKIRPESIKYSDYVMARLLYEAARDAGPWNLHWTVTNRDPVSDNIWRQWQAVYKPSFVTPTASAECDELSALYAF